MVAPRHDANDVHLVIKAARHPFKTFLVIIHLLVFYTMTMKSFISSQPETGTHIHLDSIVDKPIIQTPSTPVLRKGSTSDKFPPIQLTVDKCESPLRGHFDNIYKNKIWGSPMRDAAAFYFDAQWPIPADSPRQKSASGQGSYLGAATQHSLKIIKDTIAEYNVKSMIDVPCGDANWIHDSLVTDTLPLYIGLDIVSPVIEINKQRFGHHNNKHFMFWDATECPFPKFYNYTVSNEPQSVDLIHVRDVIQHVTLKQGVSYFCNVFKSGARVLITTTYPSATENPDIGEGGWYKNNLLKEPFSFPPTDKCTPSHPEVEPDYTCVYDLTETWVQDFMKSKC